MTPQLAALDFEILPDAKWLDFILGQIIANAAKYRKVGSVEQPVISFTAELF